MDWFIVFCVVFMNTIAADASHNINVEKLLSSTQRRHNFRLPDDPILGAPRYPEDLPKAEPIHPGHTLLRPALGMLKSAVKYPHTDNNKFVYGNLANLGISHGPYHVKYTDFRKSNNLVDRLLDAAQRIKKYKGYKKSPLIIIESPASLETLMTTHRLKDLTNNVDQNEEDNNDASEILDESYYPENYIDNGVNFRKHRKGVKSDLRKGRYTSYEDKRDCSREDSSQPSSSSSAEKNPGNPYTIHKDKYKTNWIWNTEITGDHMNINPYAPKFINYGPSGADLFYGRKWWYFNQDDYKPL